VAQAGVEEVELGTLTAALEYRLDLRRQERHAAGHDGAATRLVAREGLLLYERDLEPAMREV
jgi:hypothetical protein